VNLICRYPVLVYISFDQLVKGLFMPLRWTFFDKKKTNIRVIRYSRVEDSVCMHLHMKWVLEEG